MNAAEGWGVAGLVLMLMELATPGYFLLWIGLAALATAAATLVLAPVWQAQAAVFAVAAVALVALAARYVRRRPQPDLVNAPGANLIGSRCTALDFQAGIGRVKLRDGAWPARLALGPVPLPPPAEGAPLRVIGLEGTTLIVEPG